jgi:hypothetical protein
MPPLKVLSKATTTPAEPDERSLKTLMKVVADRCRRKLYFLPDQEVTDCIQAVLLRVLFQIQRTGATIAEFVRVQLPLLHSPSRRKS